MTMSSTQSAESVLTPSGDLTIFEAMDFRNDVVTLLSQEGPVTMDLSRVTQMDCSCLQVLLAARRANRLTVTGLGGSLGARLHRLGCHDLVPR